MTAMYLNRKCSFLNKILSMLHLDHIQEIKIIALEGGGRFITYRRHIIRQVMSLHFLDSEQKKYCIKKMQKVREKAKLKLSLEHIEVIPAAFS